MRRVLQGAKGEQKGGATVRGRLIRPPSDAESSAVRFLRSGGDLGASCCHCCSSTLPWALIDESRCYAEPLAGRNQSRPLMVLQQSDTKWSASQCACELQTPLSSADVGRLLPVVSQYVMAVRVQLIVNLSICHVARGRLICLVKIAVS